MTVPTIPLATHLPGQAMLSYGAVWDDVQGKWVPAQAVNGGMVVSPITITTATHSNTNVAASSTLILAANASRKPGSIIVCDTTAISYIKLGTGASSTSHAAQVDGKTTVAGIFLVPDGYLGVVYGIGASATGVWRAVEMA